jgi:Mg/Co/Ni transporter MgtE
VLEALRGFDEDLEHDLDEVPVVTEEGKLVGVAPLVRLLRAPADVPVTSACRSEAVFVAPSAKFDEVVAWFEKYNLRALPVADEYGQLVGLISVEDVIRRLARRG